MNNMNNMNDYTIYCTDEQIKKALELGAVLDEIDYPEQNEEYIQTDNYRLYRIPTAEQMIGWLETQADILDIAIYLYEDDGYPRMCGYGFTIYNKNKEIITGTFTEKGNLAYISTECNEYIYLHGTYTNEFLTKREATLEAIDATLEYLERWKK